MPSIDSYAIDQSRGMPSLSLESRGKEIIREYEQLLAERSNFSNLFQEVSEYILPRKQNITVVRSKGEKQTVKLFDSTAIQANELLASSLQSTLTSVSVLWFMLKPNSADLLKEKTVTEWCENSTNKMFKAIQKSNFEAEANELYLDLGAFGTAAMRMEEAPGTKARFNGLIFETLDISEYVFKENAFSVVDSVYRAFRYSTRQAKQRFGKKLSQKIQEAKPHQYFDFVHCVEKSDGRFKYSSTYVERKTGKVVDEKGFNYFPYTVPRWRKTSGEEWGRSPGMTALPDTRTLNKAKELGLKAWQRDIAPPLAVLHDSILGSINMSPNSINTVLAEGAITPIRSGAAYDISQWKEKDLRDSIENAFFVRDLRMPPFQGTPMTATEVQVRVEQMQKILGPTMGRLRYELLDRLIANIFVIMYEANAFDAIPQMLADAMQSTGELPIDVEFQGPLARSQRMSEVSTYEQFYARIIAPAMQVNPAVSDNIDFDEASRFCADRMGVSPSIVRDKRKVEDMRTERAQMQQQQQQMALEQAQQDRNVEIMKGQKAQA